MKNRIIKGICALAIMLPLFTTAVFAYPSQEITSQSYISACCGGCGGYGGYRGHYLY